MAVTWEFNQSVSVVTAKLRQESFRRERSEALGEKMLSVGVVEHDAGFDITMSRVVTRELPALIAKIARPSNTLDFEECWRPRAKGWEGTLQIQIRGLPVTVYGAFSLVPRKGGCRYRIEHQCKAKIPLLGGKVESFLCAQTDQGALDELEYLQRRL